MFLNSDAEIPIEAVSDTEVRLETLSWRNEQ